MASSTRGPVTFGTRVALVATLVFAVSVWIGLVTASAEGSLGPHRATYEITASSSGVVDLGPLGTLEVDSPLPLRLGARVTVQEVPADVTSIDAPVTLEGLSADLDRYVQFFTSPETFLQDAAGDVVRSAARHTLIAFVGLGAAITGLLLLLGPGRRTELWQLGVRRRRTSLAGVVVIVAVAGAVVATGPLGPDLTASQPASSIFDGTPLEGARLTGRLAGIVDTYGGLALDAYRENEEFYAGAEDSLRTAWAAREEQSQEWARLLELSERVSPLQRVMLGDPDSLVTMLVVSDLHCNVGMAPVLKAAVELSGAAVVLDAGDTTVNGTQVERYCVTAFSNAYRAGGAKDVVFAGGNHDSAITGEQVRAAGGTVLAGEVVNVAGIDVLGDADPLETRIGQGTRRTGEEGAAEAGERLADVGCSRDEPVPLLLVHTPAVAADSLERGCAVATVSGHLHRWAGPQRVEQGVRLVNGSTAGAVSGQATVGPLGGTATIGVLRVSPEYGLVADYQKLTVDRLGQAEVGWRMPFPLPAGMLPEREDPNLPPGAR
ncbi:MAG: metallophosphoesterase [Actinomycetales bacterium]|nr:metallophosphoesterase [Actinomycetales bacterium]